MKKKIIEEEIERKKRELAQVLISKMKEPERSNNISRIIGTILSLRKFMEKYPFDEKD